MRGRFVLAAPDLVDNLWASGVPRRQTRFGQERFGQERFGQKRAQTAAQASPDVLDEMRSQGSSENGLCRCGMGATCRYVSGVLHVFCIRITLCILHSKNSLRVCQDYFGNAARFFTISPRK